MKTSSTPAKASKAQLRARLMGAQKKADVAKKSAKVAKMDLRHARKIFKQAKKLAKAAKREVKELKAEIAAYRPARKRATKKTTPHAALPAAAALEAETVVVPPAVAPVQGED